MDFKTFVTERLAALTAGYNAIGTNAKKIDELPVQSTLDPASRLHVSRNGISERIEIQSIIDAINDNTYNQLLSIGEINLVDNIITVPLDARWQINEVIYNTISDTVITIPYAAAGFTRTDILVANTLGQIVLVQGTETAGIAVRPNIPIDTVLVTEINVTELVIGDPSPPVTLEALATKLDKDGYTGTAKTLDDRISAIELPDEILTFVTPTKTGSVIDIAALDFTWRINQVNYTNVAAFSTTIADATAGYNRIDIIVANASGTFQKIQGVESLDIAIKPDILPNTVEATFIDISGAVISSPGPALNGSLYVEKTEYVFKKLYGTGNKAAFSIVDESSSFRIMEATSIASITVSGANKKFIFAGKDHYIKNETGITLIIKHNSGTGNYKYFFPNATDLVIQNNETVHFKIRIETGNAGYFDYVGILYDKTRIGLSNVDNTSDINKPVSTLQAAADAVVLADGKTYADGLITQLIDGAPSDGNTLKELNDKIIAVQAIIGGTTSDGDSLVNTVAELLAVFSTYTEGVELVTLLAGKVNTTDVYNALDCIVAGKVADARQLKVLNDLITALTTAVGSKEDSSNKVTTFTGNETSTTKFPVVKAILDYFTAANIRSILGISTLSGSNTGDQDLSSYATNTALALKLNIADYNDRFKGVYLTLAALNAAHPTGSAGDSAQVNETGSTDVVNYSWDVEESIWVPTGSGGSGAVNTDGLPEGSSNLYFTSGRALTAAPAETATTLGALIGGSADATPNDSDFIATSLTSGGILKKITWTNAKAFLKVYFDTLYTVSQITITTSVSITTDTLDTSNYSQKGRNVVIDNSTNAINITVNGGTGFCASYGKHGTGAITFVQGSGRTLAQVDGTAVLNGAVGSTATIFSIGTKDYLRISNAS